MKITPSIKNLFEVKKNKTIDYENTLIRLRRFNLICIIRITEENRIIVERGEGGSTRIKKKNVFRSRVAPWY